MKSVYALPFAMLVVMIVVVQAAPRNEGGEQRDAGAYIVHSTSMCTDCHTPRTSRGALDTRRQLAGAKIAFRPIKKVPEWSTTSPDLTPGGQLKGWTRAQWVRFLTTGVDPHGMHAAPPMPQFRFNRADAEAITTYVKLLPAVKPAVPWDM